MARRRRISTSGPIRSFQPDLWPVRERQSASLVPTTANDVLQSVHANLLWSPFPKSTIGAEYIYGTVENGTVSTPALSNKGEAHRIQFSAQYGF